ncbi:hypothetical protein INT48_002419 [Thamnidium elegans]|uniref:Uncharacterized protein n=1 Tax=Thamnidium elegans TaxID=101142 RepID=A0A8H7SVV5_9FUNG|nr:hypothetical protein INT48_002419 [Thamnidium elegans]
MPSTWTDHQLLTIDLLPARMDFDLLSKAVNSFFERTTREANTSHKNTTSQQLWECLKSTIIETDEGFGRGYNKKYLSNLAKLEQDYQQKMNRIQGLSTSENRSTNAYTLANKVAKQLDETITKLSQETYLRSATRWHELGERKNKYFYKVIKSTQSR